MEYDLQTTNILKMLQENFNISVVDLVKRKLLKYVVNSSNHNRIMLNLLKVNRKDFNDNLHKRNYTLKVIDNLLTNYGNRIQELDR